MSHSREAATEKPEWVKNQALDSEVFLDLRRFLRHGLESLPEVEGMLRELRPTQVLRLATNEEPVQLYGILEPKGFEHFAEREGKHWNIYLRDRRSENQDKREKS